MKKMTFLPFFVFLIMFLSSAYSCNANDSLEDPTKSVKSKIDEILSVLMDPEYDDNPSHKKEQKRIACQVASEIFCFRVMMSRILAKDWHRCTNKQKDYMVDNFPKIFLPVWYGRIEGNHFGVKIDYKKQIITGIKARVYTAVTKDSITTPVCYMMILIGNKWLAYDVEIEGVSLVQNYRKQLRGGHPEETISRIKKKLESLRKSEI